MEQIQLTNGDLAIIYLALGKRIPVYDGMPEHERRCTELRDWFADVQKQGMAAEVLAMSGIDEYMPTDAEWAAYPDMIAAATDGDGEMWLYSDTPSDAQPSPIREFAIWHCPAGGGLVSLKWVTPPADFHTTLRHRPSHL